MARLLGEARVAVLGTADKAQIEAAVKKAAEAVKGKIGLDFDKAALDARLAAVEKAVNDIRGIIKLDADKTKLDAQLAVVKAEVDGIKGEVKLSANTGSIDAQLAELAVKADAFSTAMRNLVPKDQNAQSFLKGLADGADRLKGSLDSIGDQGGVDKASAALDRMVVNADKVSGALTRTGDSGKSMADSIASSVQNAGAKIQEFSNTKLTVNDDDLKAKLAEADAAVQKVTSRPREVNLGIDNAKWDLQLARLQTQLEALSAKSVKIRTDLDLAKFNQDVAKVIADSAAMEAAQEAAVNRVAKARDADALSQQKAISATQGMYDKMYAQAEKDEEAYAKFQAATEAANAASMARISKARQSDTLSEQKGIQDTRNMYSGLFDELDKRDNIKIGIDDAYTDAQMIKFRAKIAALSKSTNIRLGLDDGTAELEAVSLREKLKAILSDIKAKIKVDQSSLSTARSFITNWLTSKLGGDVANAGSSNGVKFGNGFVSGLGKSAMMQNPGITALVIAGLAALPAAIGAVGVLGGIALGAGIMIGAESLIKKQIKSITADMKSIQTQMGGTPASSTTIASQTLAVNTTKATIARLSAVKKPTAAQQQQLSTAQQRLPIQQQTLAASQAKGQGNSQQQQQLAADQKQLDQYNKYVGMFQTVNDAVTNVKLSFLQFALVAAKPLIKPFADALNALSGQLKGPLAKAFASLFKAVGPLVKPVMDALLEIVNGILPGLTQMLTQGRKPLTDLFEAFGKIVGLKVGQWFRDAIPYLKDSAHYLTMLVGIAGDVIGFLIQFGGESAKAFGGSQFKGFGKLIGQIANDLIKIVIPAFVGWTAVMAPVVLALAQIITPILTFLANHPGLVKAIAEIAAAFFLLNKAILIAEIAMGLMEPILAALDIEMEANPIGLVVLAIEALAVVAFLVVKNWKPIAGFFVGIWKDIWSGFIGPMVNWFTKSLPHAFDVSLQWVKTNWPKVTGAITKPFIEVYKTTIQIWNNTFSFLKGIWGHIENAVTGVFKPIASVIEGAWNMAVRITKDVWNVLVTIIRTTALIILGLIGEAWIGIKNVTEAAWNWIYKTTKDIWGHIENAVTGIIKPIATIVSQVWDGIKKGTQNAWNWIFNTTKDIWGHIENAVTGIIKPIATIVSQVWDGIKKGTQNAWNWIFNTTKDIWGHIENAVTGIVKPITTIISQAWNNIKKWTQAAWNWVYTYIITPVKKAWDWVNKNFIAKIGPGFQKLWGDIKKWTSDAWNAIYGFLTKPLQKAWDWVKNTFVPGIEGAFKGLVSIVSQIWSGIKSAAATPINFIINDVWNPFANFVNTGLSVFGINTKLPKGTPVKFASGGHVPGYAPGSDTVHAMLSPGEYVLNPTAVKKIGVRNLDAINSSAKPGGGQHTVRGESQAFVNGAQVLQDAEQFNGHKYVWGGPANPTGGWDCSSFVGYILGHDFNMPLPGGAAWNPNIHGPTADQYVNEPGYSLVSHNVNDIQAGDLLVENSGGHVGFGVGPNRMFSAYDTASGTTMTDAANMTQIFRSGSGGGNGLLGALGKIPLIGAVLSAAASAVINGVTNLISDGLSRVPGKGPFHDLPIAAVKEVMNAAVGKSNSNQANLVNVVGPGGNPVSAAGTVAANALVPSGISGISTTPSFAPNAPSNYAVMGKYFESLGYSKIAAAGILGNIARESGGNPESTGTGGGGLIGFTPLPGGYVTGNANADMARQLAATAAFPGTNVAAMNAAAVSPQAAADWFVSNVEHAGVVAAADREASALASFNLGYAKGGHVPGYAPGSDTVPAMLSPGEYVLNPTAVKALGVGNLNALNSTFKTGSPQKFAAGGAVKPIVNANNVNAFGQVNPLMPAWAQFTTAQLQQRETSQKADAQAYKNAMARDIAQGLTAQYLTDSQMFQKDNNILTGTKQALTRRETFDKEPSAQQALEIAGADKGVSAVYAQEQAAAFAQVQKLGATIAAYKKLKKPDPGQVKNLAKYQVLYNEALKEYMTDGQLSSHWDTLYQQRVAQSQKDAKKVSTGVAATLKVPKPTNAVMKIAEALMQDPWVSRLISGAGSVSSLGWAVQPELGNLMIGKTFNPSQWIGTPASNAEDASVAANWTAAMESLGGWFNSEAGYPALRIAGQTLGIHGKQTQGGKKSFFAGGMINEHVVGIGTQSGVPYEFGERGPERVTPMGNPGTQGGDEETKYLLRQLVQLQSQNNAITRNQGHSFGNTLNQNAGRKVGR